MPGAVHQILDNLLDNAIDVAPTGSDIALAVASRRARSRSRSPIRVPGISGGERARAFDRFSPPTRAEDGIGIGLTIVRDLTEACGGEIELLGPGGGTRAVLRSRGAARLDPAGQPSVRAPR